ncbi:hypothetical protein LRH25_12580 [Ideonella azotifigens]|uniref:Major facilitator superfamily (MFS) profile domain-containing protein n=1 Tax=Ideonella azotifigens TaxID=513160 RepID=A0ABN1KBS6_9BURK|nr:hypothetical protein [Ideonella azotifigens]MCD2341177.1 hypothetical protein [Ideonella azotifigens]
MLVFAGILASLSALASVDGFAALAVIGFLAGTCVLGAQSLIYALAPGPYPVDVRGTGVGTAIAIGRIGSVAGPALGGMLLAGGQSASMVIASAIPGVAIAATCTLLLVRRLAAMQAVAATDPVNRLPASAPVAELNLRRRKAA